MATRILANQEVTVAKLLQRLTSRQMVQQLHIVHHLPTNTACLPRVSMVHHPIRLPRDNTLPRRIVRADIRILPTEVVGPHPTMDIAQLHTNIVSNLAADRLPTCQIF